MPSLVSIIPNMQGGKGHIIPYHIAVNKVTKILGWNHQVAYSYDSQLTNLPPDWSGCLEGAKLEEDTNLLGKFTKIFQVIVFAHSIYKYLKHQVLPNSDTTIIFLERFIHLQLCALWLAILFLPTENLCIWLLYRRDTQNEKTRFVYKFLHQLIHLKIKTPHFQLLTDSELLAQSLSKYFQEKVTVMPIPHTEFKGKKLPSSPFNFFHKVEDKKPDNSNNYIICWWAGPPREEKGWTTIKNMLNCKFSQADKFCIVAAESSLLKSVEGGVNVHLIPDNLSRSEYENWLYKSDLMLLPYSSQAYSEKTSGIFTESVIAGTIPLVTPNTWMAKELSQYNLEELIIDWDNLPNVFAHIEQILTQNWEQITLKFSIMQKEYYTFHSLENYAHKFLLLTKS